MAEVEDLSEKLSRAQSLEEAHRIMEEILSKPWHPLQQEGWRYFDPPGKFKPEFWRRFLAILGEGNYHLLAVSEGEKDGEPWVRGQMLVSPDGVRRLKDVEAESE